MVVDCFTYNGEQDLLEIRLNVLNDFVDQFIIVEATETFSGRPKDLYYEKQKQRFATWKDKIKYHVVSPPYEKGIVVLANESPNTRGAAHWKTEFVQKESIKQALSNLSDDDVVFIGDVDEIWKPELARVVPTEVIKLKLLVYTYYLNNRSTEDFWGPIVGKYKNIKKACLNHLRSTEHHKTDGYGGWHFTSMGGYDEVKRKLQDSYTRESYWTPEVEDGLRNNVLNSRDFLGRGFNFWIDESNWPQYLKDNRKKYEHFLRQQ